MARSTVQGVCGDSFFYFPHRPSTNILNVTVDREEDELLGEISIVGANEWKIPRIVAVKGGDRVGVGRGLVVLKEVFIAF